MYCRNCGNEVNEKAIACPKCGFNPRSEKKFCPNCGVSTDPKQLMCVSCGVSLANKSFSIDTTNLPKVDVQSFLKNKPALFAAIALLACFMPWVKVYSSSMSVFSLADLAEYIPGTIFVSFLLILFPLSLLAFILSDYVPQLSQYKKYFSFASLALLVYCIIGFIMAKNPSTPDYGEEISNMTNNMGDFGAMTNQAMDMAKSAAKDAMKDLFSIGFGFYLSLIATVASFILFIKGK